MKINVRIAAAVLLALIGTIVAAYSYTQLRGQDVLFDQDSIQMDGYSYWGYSMGVNLDGRFAPRIIGGVGTVGCCVDFYLVNYTSWNSWSTNPESRSVLSTVHLNATAVSSQSAEGQFSFVPSASTYGVVFVNDEYPSANNATVHATIILQYIFVDCLYGLVAGLATLGTGLLLIVVLLIVMTRRKVQREFSSVGISTTRSD
jgi:hypothetical protein